MRPPNGLYVRTFDHGSRGVRDCINPLKQLDLADSQTIGYVLPPYRMLYSVVSSILFGIVQGPQELLPLQTKAESHNPKPWLLKPLKVLGALLGIVMALGIVMMASGSPQEVLEGAAPVVGTRRWRKCAFKAASSFPAQYLQAHGT